MPAYLDPVAPIAPRALLTDDPKSAMELAVALTGTPRMSNLAHGLWGYHGQADDHEITVQSLGIGGPSAAAVLSDLAELGVTIAIRIGSCIGIDPALAAGSVVVASVVRSSDGIPLAPDRDLTGTLEDELGVKAAPVRSLDFHGDLAVAGDGTAAADLSSGALLATASRIGVRVACALVVARSADGAELSREGLESVAVRVGAQLSGVLQPS